MQESKEVSTFIPPLPENSTMVLQQGDVPSIVAEVKRQLASEGGSGGSASPTPSPPPTPLVDPKELQKTILKYEPIVSGGMFLDGAPQGVTLVGSNILFTPVLEMNSEVFRYLQCRGTCNLEIEGQFDSKGSYSFDLKIRGFTRNYAPIYYDTVAVTPYSWKGYPTVCSLAIPKGQTSLTSEGITFMVNSLFYDASNAKFKIRLDVTVEGRIDAAPESHGWGELFPMK